MFLKSSFKRFIPFLIVAGFLFGFFGIKSAFASYYGSSYYSQVSSPTSFASYPTYVFNSGPVHWYATTTSPSNVLVSDSSYMIVDLSTVGQPLSNMVLPISNSFTSYFGATAGLGDSIDKVCIGIYGTSTISAFNSSLSYLQYDSSTAHTQFYPVNVAGQRYDFCGTFSTPESRANFSASTLGWRFGNGNLGVYSGQLSIDFIDATVWYHGTGYNGDTPISLFVTTYTGFNPQYIVSTSSISFFYYINSTRYNAVEYWVHDNFTNTDSYIDIPFTAPQGGGGSGFGTSTISNFCNGGLLTCFNGDTYLINAQFVNTTGTTTIKSGYGVTQLYVAYNGYNPPTLITSTTTYSSTTLPFTPTNSTTTVSQLRNLLFTSSTTGAVGTYCNIASIFSFNNTFSITSCLYYLILPAVEDLNSFIATMRDGVFSQIPFIGNLWTTSAGTLPVIDATIPNGVMGAGSHIRLDLSHQLDYILNATSSIYSSGSATSTQTLYQITSQYWNYFVYVMMALYFLSRIFSVRIFGITTNGLRSNFNKKIKH